MKKFILAPDSFKGTLSSLEITDILKKIIEEHLKSDVEIHELPITDGGENSIPVFHKIIGGDLIYREVTGPNFNRVHAKYLIKDQRAIIEMAECAGLHLYTKLDCKETTTYGVGELILDAISRNCTEILLCIGGSSTNDCGVGLLSALGIKFLRQDLSEFIPTGGTLHEIAQIKNSLKIDATKITFKALSDVKNRLLGNQGATYVYGPQKGATPDDLILLERNCLYFTQILQNNLENLESTGAGGGIIYGIKSFFQCDIESGIDYLLKIAHFDELLEGCDYVITGEGKIDAQTKNGKVIDGICRHAKKKDVKVIALTGVIGENIEELFENGLSSVISINQGIMTLDEAKKNAKKNLENTFKNIVRLFE